MIGPVAKAPWHPLGDPGDHYWLVQRMAKTCGVDMAKASEAGCIDQRNWVKMVQRCRSCQWTEGCERWLSRLELESGAHPAPPEDCLNAAILNGLAEEKDNV
jgi:hypothetical protein